ncbi:uncharacterized protein F5Z01DRAFT_637954 [Emericellopsis atlantica]|uniref:Uncharacterized protein n=1 Tax=Emericellopsis atlantica TaxID=2614577 RepID=A0A9P7ZIL8_9HYPO|nr:uncharacterized protein F5Z01DRAFT_637954 [Emericellopsis atlantica]KAG9252789.1 hypothetical protein F5Z01DRAFT_637954 [Emericellopsis atlantica]
MPDHSPDASGSRTPAVQPNTDDMSVIDVMKSLVLDPKGIVFLGDDGVLRSIDGERKTVIDARGLSPAQIKEYFEPFQSEAGWGIKATDGRGVSRKYMFHPAEGLLPPKVTPEERAETLRYNEQLRREGVTCDVPKPSGGK